MARVYSSCQGFRKSGSARNQLATRLGDGSVVTHAQTWQTFGKLSMFADGSWHVKITRNDTTLLEQEGGPEDERL